MLSSPAGSCRGASKKETVDVVANNRGSALIPSAVASGSGDRTRVSATTVVSMRPRVLENEGTGAEAWTAKQSCNVC